MRVANIIEEGKLGGPQVRIVMVAAALKELVETTVVVPKENSKLFQKRCQMLGVRFKVMPITRITKEWRAAMRYVLFSFFEIVQLAFYFRKQGFNLIHVSGGSWQYKGIIAGKLAGIKILWHLNDTFMPFWIRWLFRIFSLLPDGFVYSSECTRNYYESLIKSGGPKFVIPAPVDVKEFNPEIEYTGDQEIIDQLRGRFVVGTVANVNSIKGLDVIIRCASRLNKSSSPIHFVIVGPIYNNQRKYYESLLNLCKELNVSNVQFVGEREDVRHLMQRFDVYLCSSSTESSPIAVWEAMAMGKSIISTSVGDVPMYIQNGRNGFLVDVGDYEGCADHLETLMADSQLRERFGKEARATATRCLDISHCAELHLKAYEQLL